MSNDPACVAGVALRTPTDRTRWWNCSRRAGLAERRCERCVPVWVWLKDVVKDIVKDVLQRGFGVKDVAYIEEMTSTFNIFEIQQRLSHQTHAGARLPRCLSRRLSAKPKQEHVFHNVFQQNSSAKHIFG